MAELLLIVFYLFILCRSLHTLQSCTCWCWTLLLTKSHLSSLPCAWCVEATAASIFTIPCGSGFHTGVPPEVCMKKSLCLVAHNEGFLHHEPMRRGPKLRARKTGRNFVNPRVLILMTMIIGAWVERDGVEMNLFTWAVIFLLCQDSDWFVTCSSFHFSFALSN